MSRLSDVLPTLVDDSVEEWKKHPRYPDLWVCNQGRFRRGETLEDSKPLKVYDSKNNGGKSRTYFVLYGYHPTTKGGSQPIYLTANKLVAEVFLPNTTGAGYDHVSCRNRNVEPPYRASNLMLNQSASTKAKTNRRQADKPYAPYTYSSLINGSYSILLENKLYKGEVTPEEAGDYLLQRSIEDGIRLYENSKAALAAGRQKGVKKPKRKKGEDAE